MSYMMVIGIRWGTFLLPLVVHQYQFLQHEERKRHFASRCFLTWGIYLLSGLGISFLITMGLMSPHNPVIYIGIFLITLLNILLCFDISMTEAVFVATCGYAVQHIGYSVADIFLYKMQILEDNVLATLIGTLLCQMVVGALVYIILTRRMEHYGEYKERDNRIVALAGVVLFCTVGLSLWSTLEGSDNDSVAIQIFVHVICKLYAIVSCILVLAMEIVLSRMNMVDRQKTLMEQMIHTMGSQQALSRESVAIINRKCHDIKYQMKALRNMNQNDFKPEYITELQKAISIYDSVYHTGNEPLNLLLREKTLLCDEYEIQFSCMAEGDLLYFMETDDLYVLLGNILDNAIESVVKEPEKEKRVIGLNISEQKKMIYIHAENYCGDAPEFKDGLPKTTKEDKAYHGFGVRSIQYICNKYKGNLLMQQRGDTFYVDILFPLK